MVNKRVPFSVLMSVYHGEKPCFLDSALKSIEVQTLKPKEFILVIDGPISNKLKKIISFHKQSYPDLYKVVESSVNQGLGKSLQLGSKYITTNWIARMDSDDIAIKNRFDLQIAYIEKHPNIAVLGGQIAEFIGDENNIVGFRRVPISEELIKNYIVWRSPFNHPSVIINKKCLDSVGGYRAFGKLEDYDLWVRIIQHHYKVYNLPNILVNMRVDNGIYSRRGDLNNLRYIFKLRRNLRKGGGVTFFQEYIGDILMIINIVIPGWLRKLIYQKILHRRY